MSARKQFVEIAAAFSPPTLSVIATWNLVEDAGLIERDLYFRHAIGASTSKANSGICCGRILTS